MESLNILCISDHIDPLVYSYSIRDRFADVDLILSSGDLPFNYYDYIVSNLNRPLFFVFGNHNLDRIGFFQRRYQDYTIMGQQVLGRQYGNGGATYVGGKVVRSMGLLIAGLGGSMWYNGGRNQYTDTGMFFSMLRLMPRLVWNKAVHGRFLDVLVTHAPPYRVGDLPDRCHTGFKALRWFLRTFRPSFLVHGHVHLYELNARRVRTYADTVVINAYSHYLLRMEDAGT